MSISGVPSVPVAMTCMLGLVAGLLTASPATGGAEQARPLRLQTVEGSGLAELSEPLAPALDRRTKRERRTPRLRTSGHSMVALTWRGRAPEMHVRSRTAEGWGRWIPAPPLTDLPDAGGREDSGVRGTHPLWVGASDAVQVSVRGPSPDDLELVLIDPGTRTAGTDTRPAPTGRTSLRTSLRTTGAPRPDLRMRSDWGANPDWRNGRARYNDTLKQVHVHHTVNGNGYSRADVPGLIRGMYRYHTHNLGWSDLGYNFLVDRFGRTWVGRAGGANRRVRGAHTLGFNHSSTGVAVIGNLEQRIPGPEVIRAVSRLAAWKLDRDDRDARGRIGVRSEGSDRYPDGTWVRLPYIDGHRDTNHTACPGQQLYDRLPEIRRRAQYRIDRY